MHAAQLEVLQALPDGWRVRSTIPPAYAAPEDDPTGVTRGFLWRLSGASHEAAMIGLGDIVLPALALAYGRRVDLCHPSGTPPACGYFLWAVIGYGVGLLVTQAANVYGWTFNNVQGQPALLYLVPGVLLTQIGRALACNELSAMWHGGALVSGGGGPASDSGSESAADETKSTARLLHRTRDGGKRCWCD